LKHSFCYGDELLLYSFYIGDLFVALVLKMTTTFLKPAHINKL